MREHETATRVDPDDIPTAPLGLPLQGGETGTDGRVDPDGPEREATSMVPNQHSDADADFATDAARTYHGGPEQA